MKPSFIHLAFVAGILAIAWTGSAYVGTNALALGITAAIAVFFLLGSAELFGFRQSTLSLQRALGDLRAPLSDLDEWLKRVPPQLQHAVRRRVEGAAPGLPSPTMTPYLVGLLVLLGMLGTFLGMVVTLHGTGLALQSASDPQAIRASLVGPVKGLGLAFGTSVAGVAASAMLGLMSALGRRERLAVDHLLEGHIASTLRNHSAVHQRESTLDLLRRQADALPSVLAGLQTLMQQMERQAVTLDERLLAAHERLQTKVVDAHSALAASVERSLRSALEETPQLTATRVTPIVEGAMQQVASEAAALHARVGEAAEKLLETQAARAETGYRRLLQVCETNLQRQDGQNASAVERMQSFVEAAQRQADERAVALMSRLDEGQQRWQAQWSAGIEKLTGQAADLQNQMAEAASRRLSVSLERITAGDEERRAAWSDALQNVAAALESRFEEAGRQARSHQQGLWESFERTAQEVQEQGRRQNEAMTHEIRQLMRTADEALRSAAAAIGTSHRALSDSAVRDKAVLEERQRLMDQLQCLLDGLERSCVVQGEALESLLSSVDGGLRSVMERFETEMSRQSSAATETAGHLTASAVEVASLGEAFAGAVDQFCRASGQLVDQLSQVEKALGRSTARSDEQLAYYVAQAREVIDLSLMAQKRTVDDLERLASKSGLTGED